MSDFTRANTDEIVGALSRAKARQGFQNQRAAQTEAWEQVVAAMQACGLKLLRHEPQRGDWEIIFEYPIPRRNKHPDVILLAGDVVFVLEFKVGASTFDRSAKWQAREYALDLRDFHELCNGRTIVPFLVITGNTVEVPQTRTQEFDQEEFDIEQTVCAHSNRLASKLEMAFMRTTRRGAQIDGALWERAAYRPTLGIIEAAAELFASHSVDDIAHAFSDNLGPTTEAVVKAIHDARRDRRRVICFVTGVPGAGKTLAGLNVVHDARLRSGDSAPAVFLSGNGPLVRIVTEALTLNRAATSDMTRGEARRQVKTFIQSVHAFVGAYAAGRDLPHEHAIVFDEAQRAWDAKRMLSKRQEDRSEPAMLFDIMERLPDWCAIIALVGGGQEINTGEAGLSEWGRALNARSTPWRVLASEDALHGGASVSGHALFQGPVSPQLEIVEERSLHLTVSVRSHRARLIGDWVNAVIDAKADSARRVITQYPEFPIALTRDLEAARSWLRDRAGSDSRCGLLASSGALRLRAHGLELSTGFRREQQYANWFLSPADDIRSSSALEIAASEFECQGLELEWTCVCWGHDVLFQSGSRAWEVRQFAGPKWNAVRSEVRQNFILNKYRVLLTRARRGMIIWVPRGSEQDPTRPPAPLDQTADFLVAAGVPLLEGAP